MKEATIKRGQIKFKLADETESDLNTYINCRDGVIKKVSYRDCSGYGIQTDAFYCIDTKHESVSLIVQKHIDGKIYEESLHFDSDSYSEFKKLFTEDCELFRTY